jgi:hypothetical protein
MSTRNDARLWARMVNVLRTAGASEPDTLARALIALVRAEDPATPGGDTYGPGEQIPPDVTVVYDLDGDRWQRVPDVPDGWRMHTYDPDEHESSAGGIHLTPDLLTAYGPVTAMVSKPAPSPLF